MKTLKTIAAFALVLGSCLICTIVRAEDPAARSAKPGLRVGTFDSRAIVIAYANSTEFNQSIKKLKEERDKAKAEGNDKKVKQLEEKGKSAQQMFHMQGFSTASVNDILEHIKHKLPDVARQAGVDLIVSKWEIVYKTPDTELVDITDALVKQFNPSERTLKTVSELSKHPPIPLQEAMNIND
jgi:Skp family chaperone for outer membrane proteins